jgi:hypothetical protein
METDNEGYGGRRRGNPKERMPEKGPECKDNLTNLRRAISLKSSQGKVKVNI